VSFAKKEELEMNEIHQSVPRARTSQLITKEVAGEMLVYDRNSDKAHCLNPTAALIWSHCDGQTTVAEMAKLLAGELKTPVADEVVWFALDQLEKISLLQERWARPAKMDQM
jgi:Coenzyme PQQ synthesis protein D (PqqD)